MNAAGIDVSKGKSMVTILRPLAEMISLLYEVRHSSIPSYQISPFSSYFIHISLYQLCI